MEKRHWINPLDELLKLGKPIYRTGLMVNNSLFPSEKVEFVTKDGSRNIKWYMCGPTVYDKSHLGHARTYIGFDIIKRILESYFGYNIELVMNITDIDDKIIKKIIDQNSSLLEITRKYEDLFFQDMEKLNVMYPDKITRVTEYVEEIIAFIQKLISNGYAYESNGSVYFDIGSFTKNEHVYAKLDPSKIGSKEVEQENDGVLGVENKSDKRSANDFALWKKSKEKEPFWNSPWGEGRPGWHIECSAMCTEIFGESLDIHSGGIDLKFPHHDNEIAQTEGYYNHKQWINYFIHTGHLNIDGLKMSKSLKNFFTIDDILKQGYTANSFRLQFLSHKYDTEMNYSEKEIQDAREKDKKFKEFFRTLKRLLTENNTQQNLKFKESDHLLDQVLSKAKLESHSALCDNFNTKIVMESIGNLMTAFYKYEKIASSEKSFNILLGYSVGKFINFMLKSFGLVYQTEFLDSFSFKDNNTESDEKIIKPYVEALVQYRERIRVCAQNKDFKAIFDESDKLRNDILPYLGIRLKDRIKEDPIWTYEDKETLIKEIELEAKLKFEKEEEKRKKKEHDDLKLNTPAKEWFSMQTNIYSAFDNDGVPTHKFIKDDKTAELISTQLKQEEYNKLKKEFKSHQDKHLKHLEKANK